ncbi:hypothetical protein X731_03000 [Mesorhizobium sp. L2C054A000]|nr:hypothetical protein X731_03000 [Mesorhizobium sp. L2C054A000]
MRIFTMTDEDGFRIRPGRIRSPSAQPGLVGKPIQRVSKRNGGIATLVRGHQSRFKFQPEVRQLGSNGATSAR